MNENEPTTCPKCHNPVGDVFCPECGENLGDPTALMGQLAQRDERIAKLEARYGALRPLSDDELWRLTHDSNAMPEPHSSRVSRLIAELYLGRSAVRFLTGLGPRPAGASEYLERVKEG